MINFEQNIHLESKTVLLRPLNADDFQPLKEIAFDKDIWKFTPNIINDENDLNIFIMTNIKARENNTRYTFAIIDKETMKIAGTSAFGSFSEADKRTEIGWTWLGRAYRKTGLNKAVKFLMLQYAFEKLFCERVEFKTDVLNLQSRKALIKIGAVEEGILRSHTRMHSNRRRDTIFYSILFTEWEKLKSEIFNEFVNT